MSDKVSAELDATLKDAVKSKVTIKKDLDKVVKTKNVLLRNLDDLKQEYEELTIQEAESARLNEETQGFINTEVAKNRVLKEKKAALQTTNIEVCQKMDKAIKDYNEVKGVIAKLDESRNIMNRLMGPGGVLTDAQRKAFLAADPEEHDRMVTNIGAGGRTAM